MSYTPVVVRYNTNPYAPGFNGSLILTRNDIPTLPTYYSPAPSYIDWWYPRGAKFWKIPKGSKNIKFKIPHWYTGDLTKKDGSKQSWGSTYMSEGTARYGTDYASWGKDPQKTLDLVRDVVDMHNAMGEGWSIPYPDPDLLYTMQDGFDFSRQEVASYCHNCNASLQVFHTNGRLLAGTPLRNWDTARASYWDIGPAGQTITASGGTQDQYITTEETEARWLKEGLWTSWYTMVQTSKTGVYYFDSPTPVMTPSLGTQVTPAMLSALLQELYPDIFSSSFSFDDTAVNGNGLELYKSNNFTLNFIAVDSETISWSGNAAGAIGSGAGDRMAVLGSWHSMLSYTPTYHNMPCVVNPEEILEIAYANEDLIVGVITNDYVGVVGSWDEYSEDPPEPDTGPYMRTLSPCPATLRYHPLHLHQAPYAMTTLSCTDRLHKKTALYFPIRDQVGCIEVRKIGDGTNIGGKRIYVDHSFWYKHSPNPVEVMDMTFGYDYQRLYVLYKQSIDVNITLDSETIIEKKQYRAWITMYDTNLPDGTITDSRVSIPLYGFIKTEEHIHPFAPAGISNVLGYMETIGLTGELLDRPELKPAFNILSVHDKLFATIPCIFKPVDTPDGVEDGWWWKPDDARLLCQLLYMFDETYSTFNHVAIIGAISPWLEDWQTPLPDIEPKYPFKLRMSLADEMVMWTLAEVRKHPQEYYDPLPTREEGYPGMMYHPNMWDGTDLPDRFWQPLTLEAVTIDELINSMTSVTQTYSRPITFRGQQVYVHNPVTTNLYNKSVFTWEGQRIFGTRDHFLYEDRVVYHNFRRKILTGIGPVTRIVPGENREAFPESTFNPIDEWEGNLRLFPFSQPVTLEPGSYTAYLRGADGAPAIDADSGAVYASGGQGATVRVDFNLDKSFDFDVYVGHKGTSWEGGGLNGGNGGSYIKPSEKSIWNNMYKINELFESGKKSQYNPPIGGFGLFWKIPAGATNIRVKLSNVCPAHNASIQTFHTDGSLLTGTLPSGTNNLWSWFQNTPKGSASSLKSTLRMKEIYGGQLPAGFTIDPSEVNEKMGHQSYTADKKVFEVEGEHIEWTGNVIKGGALNSKDGKEELYIPKVHEDMIIGILASHWFDLQVDYDMPSNPTRHSLGGVIAGGGGGLTAIFLDQTPLAIAGAGGGAGNPLTLDDEADLITEANGGHGGSFDGVYGTLHSVNMQRGGGQSNGYQRFYGQSANETQCPGGGGGAGYFGGTAYQIANSITAPGGGGGSSFVLGAEGYGTYPRVPGLKIKGYTVVEGSNPPWATPQDGQVIITGYKTESKTETVIDYQFISHDVGDMYYQCASGADENKTQGRSALNVIILNDCTTSMSELILTLSGAMSALVNGVVGSKYDDIQFAAVGYANNQIMVDTTGGDGKAFTQSETVLSGRMANIANSVTYRRQHWGEPSIPYGQGDAETWADAIVQSYNILKSNFFPGNFMVVIVTDDVNDWDNPAYKADEAISICTNNNGSVTWVLPTYYTGLPTDSSQKITNATKGAVICSMEVGLSDWGGKVAQQIVESAPDPVFIYDLGFAHVFSIENLSCHTYMCDVTLTSTKEAIKLGYLPPCDPEKVFGMSGELPSLRTLHWDEIPPHTEAFFIISYETPKLTIPDTVQFEGHSFRLITESLTWPEAKARCEELGGHLVTIPTQAKQDFLMTLTSQSCWIGGFTQTGSNTGWEWVTGEPWSYENFAPAQPDYPGGGEPYLQIGVTTAFADGKWNNWLPTSTLPFICEWDFDYLPTPVSLSCDALQRGIKLSYYLEGRVEQ